MWHFRRGGLEQVRAWRERQATALPPTIDRIGARVPSPRARTFGDLRAAVILDEFSMRAWGGEFDVVAVTPMQWRAQLAEQPVDLVLAESAWNGNAGAWQ